MKTSQSSAIISLCHFESFHSAYHSTHRSEQEENLRPKIATKAQKSQATMWGRSKANINAREKLLTTNFLVFSSRHTTEEKHEKQKNCFSFMKTFFYSFLLPTEKKFFFPFSRNCAQAPAAFECAHTIYKFSFLSCEKFFLFRCFAFRGDDE